MNLTDRYTQALTNLPRPGGGGCHAALLGVCNLGIRSGLHDQQIFNDLRSAIPIGGRTVPDGEIKAAIARSRQDVTPFGSDGYHQPFRPSQRPQESQAAVSPSYRDALINRGAGFTEYDFWEASPIRLPEGNASAKDAQLLIETLFTPDDILFIGERYTTRLETAEEWKRQIEKYGTAELPHIAVNPFDGKLHPSKSGKPSYRCDAAISQCKYCLAEFDNLNRDEQLAFWAACPLPVAALIDSGNKSLHAWIHLGGALSIGDWERLVKKELYDRRLVPLGVDRACSNPARLSRLPGHFRGDKGNWQRLIYLNPEPNGRPIMEQL